MAKLESLFASRFLKARKSNKLLSFLSITSVVGVMLGVATLITVVSVMDGFSENLKAKFLGSNPHILISYINGQQIADWEKYKKVIETDKDVSGVSPLILGQAMISTNKEVSGIIIRGIEPLLENSASTLGSTVVVGKLNSLEREDDRLPGILIGQEIAFRTGVTAGQEITLISPNMNRSAFGFVPKMKKFRVVGWFDTGIHDHNKTLAYVNIKDAQDFYGMANRINAITVYTHNADKADETAIRVQKAIGEKFHDSMFLARDWLKLNGTLFAALKLEQFAMFIILTLIIIVASFNIVSMITVTVKDKRKEIAILKAMGASESLIRKIFVRQGLTIGLIGTILGDLLALLIGFVLTNFEIIEIPKEIYHSSTVPMSISPMVYAVVTICAVFITYVASAIPAKMSAKVDPIEAIRND